jgi:hypothetical protein
MMGGSTGSQTQAPGTLSPLNAVLLSLFGANPKMAGGQFVAGSDPFSAGSAFTPGSFGALTGLMQNRPATGTESMLAGPDFQGFAAQQALGTQGLFQQGAAALPALLETDPTASIAAAKRQFTEETVPGILERAPGFSSSDLQRELTRGGTDLGTNIAAMKEANLGRVGQVVQGLPAFAGAMGSNLLDQASQLLGFGQLGREFLTEVSPAGDALRTLTALQAISGQGYSSRGFGQNKSWNV